MVRQKPGISSGESDSADKAEVSIGKAVLEVVVLMVFEAGSPAAVGSEGEGPD